MGSPNFSPDNLLNRTFGYEPETDEYELDSIEYEEAENDASYVRSEIEKGLEELNKNLFGACIENGYHCGFVIHSEGVSSNYRMGSNDKNAIIEDMYADMHRIMGDRDLLEGFMDGTSKTVINELENASEEYPARRLEEMYILEVMNMACEEYDQFEWILDSHSDVMLNALDEAGIKISDYDDAERLYCDIDEALVPKALRQTISECVEADALRLEEGIALIAQTYNLKQLMGKGFTSGLRDVDYNEIMKEYQPTS